MAGHSYSTCRRNNSIVATPVFVTATITASTVGVAASRVCSALTASSGV
jgi:hypothetical protein